MYSVNRKNWENNAPASSTPDTFEPVSVRSRKIRSGSSGAFERSSITTKATMSATEAASSATVSVVPQPCCAACVIPYTSSINPPVIDAAPAASK